MFEIFGRKKKKKKGTKKGRFLSKNFRPVASKNQTQMNTFTGWMPSQTPLEVDDGFELASCRAYPLPPTLYDRPGESHTDATNRLAFAPRGALSLTASIYLPNTPSSTEFPRSIVFVDHGGVFVAPVRERNNMFAVWFADENKVLLFVFAIFILLLCFYLYLWVSFCIGCFSCPFFLVVKVRFELCCGIVFFCLLWARFASFAQSNILYSFLRNSILWLILSLCCTA